MAIKKRFLIKKSFYLCANIFATALLYQSAFASGSAVTLQGRITKPDGEFLEENSVLIRAQVLTPDVNECILFEETHTADLTDTKGFFSVSLNDGTGTRNDVNAWNFVSALSNISSFSISSTQCTTGAGTIVYTPIANHDRKVAIFFKRASMPSWEEMTDPLHRPSMTPAPNALEAQKVSGFAAANLCRVANSGVPQTISALSSTQWSDLLDIISGSSAKYLTSSISTGTSLPLLNGTAPASSTEGSIWYDTSTHEIIFNDGSGTPKPVGSGGGGSGDITSVVAGTGLTGGATTGAATINVDIGTGSGKLFTIDQIPHCASNKKIEMSAGPVYTFSCANETPDNMIDADADTKIQLEKTADEDKIRFTTLGTEKMIIDNTGKVGIGTSLPEVTLDVQGAVKSLAISNSGVTIDFSGGNLQYTSASCAPTILKYLKSGGTYNLVFQGNAGGACTFTAYSDNAVTPLNIKTGTANLTQTAPNHMIFSFLVLGSDVYVMSADGY